jgi:N-acetyl-gamma-glutamyl-phosphate reductase
MKIGVVGASGYSGGELLRLLASHPHFEIEYIAAGSQAGVPITDLHPQLISFTGENFEATSIERMNDCSLLFFALPHGESAKYISEINSGIRVVDLGADFRLNSALSWEKYYGGVHAGTWVYGLPEIPGQRIKITEASRVANPGCYATAIALAAAPALAHGLIEAGDIVVVAASGTTGAGRKSSNYLLASEVMGSLSSYKFGGAHQHTPEIEETLHLVTRDEVKLSFTPILAPMPRGILATVTSRLTKSIDLQSAHDIYQTFFASEKFIHVLPGTSLPHTSAVVGSNSTLLQVAIDEHTDRLIISAAIDNLGKGAASQAIQNANLMVGIDEHSGLSVMGVGA